MRTVFLCRDGAAARFLAHEMSARGLLHAIVVEGGGAARRRKLRREWRRTPWWRIPGFVLDMLALTVYGRIWQRALARRLRGHPASGGWPDGVPRTHVDDANGDDCVVRLGELAPDVLVVLGTAILKAPVLTVPRRAALNVHGGIVPAYRNVHSEVWAVLNGEPEAVGTSILHLDEGIDSGAVALQRRVAHATGFLDLRWRNLVLSAELVVEALALEGDGILPRHPQAAGEAGFWPTPGWLALVRLLFRRVRF